MKTVTWAPIIIAVHDVWSFGALLLLTIGELILAYLNRRKPKR